MGFASRGVGGLNMIDFWGDTVGVTVLNNIDTTKALSDVAIPNITGYTIEKAYALLRIVTIYDSSGATNVSPDGAKNIQVNKAAAGWINAIALLHETWLVAANAFVLNSFLVGGIDISSRVAFGATTNFQYTDADASGISMIWHGCQTGVRLIVTKT